MRKHIAVICFIIAVIVCFCSIKKIYPTPEAFCQEQHLNALATICGEKTVFIMYQESPGKCKFAFLKGSGDGFISIGFREVQKRINDSNYEVIYKGSGTDEHYAVLMLTDISVIPQIKDSVSSSFSYIPIELPTSEKQEMAYYAIAYIGDKPDVYYRNEYSYDIIIED